MALCLNQLLQNKRSSPFILINDSIQFSGLSLLSEFATTTLRENQGLIVVLTETSPTAWLTRLQQHTTTITQNNDKNTISIIDAYTDPLGWDDQTEIVTNQQLPTGVTIQKVQDIRDMERSILKPIIEKITTPGSECSILIDSIHPLLMISQQRTYQLIKALESLTTGNIIIIYYS